jgi:hypothetical protein
MVPLRSPWHRRQVHAARGIAGRLGAIGALLLAYALPAAPPVQAQVVSLPIVVRDYPAATILRQLCSMNVLERVVGGPVAGMEPVAKPVHVQIYELELLETGGRWLTVGLLGFNRLSPTVTEETIRVALAARGVELRGRPAPIAGCLVYSLSAGRQLSHPHKALYRWQSYQWSWEELQMRPHRPVEVVLVALAEHRPSLPPQAAEPHSVPVSPAPAAGRAGAKPARPMTRPDRPVFDKTGPGGVAAAPVEPTSPAAPREVATVAPPATEPRREPGADPPKSTLKRYPPPNYQPGVEPLRITGTGKMTAFAVESVQCSEEGNWLVGYLGTLQPAKNGKATLVLQQRHALNNYPGEGVAAGRDGINLEELKEAHHKVGNLLQCDAEQRECSAPWIKEYALYRKELLEARRMAGGANPDWARQWSCRPDTGWCTSQERDYWRCDVNGRCLTFDPTRWWCAVRQEFCYSRVKFGDWGSALKVGDDIELRLDQSQVLLYDMAHGLLPIAQEALTRVCGAGQSKGWKASWIRQG